MGRASQFAGTTVAFVVRVSCTGSVNDVYNDVYDEMTMREQDPKESRLRDHGELGGGAVGPGATDAADAADAAARLRHELAAVADGGGSREELQAAARALIAELRRRQLPAEQALVQLKEILAEAGLRPSYAAPASEPIGLHATAYRDIIAWSIRAYYEGDGRSG